MSKPSKKRLEKKKQREKQAKKVVMARREVMRAKTREKREDEKYILSTREKLKPIQNEKVEVDERIQKLKQIEQNLKVLEALKEEYMKDMQVKENLNAELEAQGYASIKEKMDALNEKAQEYAREFGDESEKKMQ